MNTDEYFGVNKGILQSFSFDETAPAVARFSCSD